MAGVFQFTGSIASMPPSEYVQLLQAVPPFGIPLQYLCGGWGNGGNAKAISVLSQLRSAKPPNDVTLTQLTAPDFDLMLKGQGYYDDFVKVFLWMDRNREFLKTVKVNYSKAQLEKDFAKYAGYSAEKIASLNLPENKTIVHNGESIYDAYFKPVGGNSVEALKAMAADKVFGIDCIGFVSQYLIHADIIATYPGLEPSQFHRHFPKIKSIADVAPLSILTWGNAHIAIIENIRDGSSEDTRIVDICQSSSKGPQFNQGATLKQTNFKLGFKADATFVISGSADVKLPVASVNGATLFVGKAPQLSLR
jgi:hypothetical protein